MIHVVALEFHFFVLLNNSPLNGYSVFYLSIHRLETFGLFLLLAVMHIVAVNIHVQGFGDILLFLLGIYLGVGLLDHMVILWHFGGLLSCFPKCTILHSPLWQMMLSIFSCVYWPSEYHLWRNVFSNHLHIFKICLFFCWIIRVLYIFCIQVPYFIYYWQIISFIPWVVFSLSA